LYAAGATTLGSTLSVTGASTFEGDVTFNGNVSGGSSLYGTFVSQGTTEVSVGIGGQLGVYYAFVQSDTPDTPLGAFALASSTTGVAGMASRLAHSPIGSNSIDLSWAASDTIKFADTTGGTSGTTYKIRLMKA